MTVTINQRGTDLAVTHAPVDIHALGGSHPLRFLDEVWVQAFVLHLLHQDGDIDVYPPVDDSADRARLT